MKIVTGSIPFLFLSLYFHPMEYMQPTKNVTDLTKSLSSFLTRHDLCESSMLLAVSGGCDSMALLHAFLQLRQSHKIFLGIAHVDHNLRITSIRDAAFAQSIAEEHGLPCFVHTVAKGLLDGSDVENRARNIRYEFFQTIKKSHDYDWIATAHTANDQAETLLMRALRGTGGRGLAGIHVVRADGVIRPLLSVDRSDIESWMTAQGFSWVEDETNALDIYARNRVRHHLLPAVKSLAGDDSVGNLAEIADGCGVCASFMDGVARRWLIGAGATFDDARPSILRKKLQDEPWLVCEGLSLFFRQVGITPDAAMIERLRTGADRTGKRILLSGGYEAVIGRERVEICRIESVGR